MIETTTPATDYPVTLQEAKAQLGLGDEVTDFDAQIVLYIKAATGSIEQYTGLRLMTQTVKLWLPCFPVGKVDLGVAPIQSVTEVAYTDTEGDAQTLAVNDDYYPMLVGAYPALYSSASWPNTQDGNPLAASVIMTVGYSSRHDVPDPLKAAILMRVHELFDNRGESIASDELTPNFLTLKMLCHPYRRMRAG